MHWKYCDVFSADRCIMGTSWPANLDEIMNYRINERLHVTDKEGKVIEEENCGGLNENDLHKLLCLNA